MRRARRLLLVCLFAVIGGLLFEFYASSSPPDGQHPLIRLNSATFDDFRREFNATPDTVRIIALLSPT